MKKFDEIQKKLLNQRVYKIVSHIQMDYMNLLYHKKLHPKSNYELKAHNRLNKGLNDLKLINEEINIFIEKMENRLEELEEK